ncbi:helix-turn-helix domain-containing protein [Sphingobacterium sp. SG20118]|uniref:helix-turn-helix domain-containing protein n=1 Tax=Sphingobacterium sp. SG20118 TaxID=3367156 RepID=UPI0037DFC9C6
MARTQNKVLAAFISKRFNTLMKEIGLSLEEFAIYTNVKVSSFRSYHSGTVPVSLETVDKICEACGILLSDFTNGGKKLTINNKIKDQVISFQTNYRLEKLAIIQDKSLEFSVKPTGNGNKWQREMIKYIILHTDYFLKPKSIAEMVVDFAKEFDFTLESGRIYELLRKYVDNELKKEKSTRINNDSTQSNRTIFLYSKA